MSTSTPTPPPADTAANGGPGGPGRPGDSGNSNRFFGWIRSLGIVRADGWISGVCGGIAIRTGLDPLIVRGVAIVAAILGGPAFLFYAIAWLLLPDTKDEIHLEKLMRGVFEPVVIGIGVVLILTFLPVAQGFWWVGGSFAHNFWWAPIGVLKVLWNLAIVALIVWFVFWLVRRVHTARANNSTWRADSTGGADSASRSAAAGVAFAGTSAAGPDGLKDDGPKEPGDSTAGDGSGGDGGAAEESAATRVLPVSEPAAPAAPGSDASAEELARWREQHEAWRAQQDAWRAQLRADQRLQREQRSAQIRAQSQEMAAQAEAARATRRARNPRTSGWYVALTLGVALLSGGIAAAVANGNGLTSFAAPIGLAAALVAVGVAMFVAGVMRRRAGFLAAVAIVLALGTYGSFALPNPALDGTGSIGYAHLYSGVDTSFTQLAGRINIQADFTEGDPTTRTMHVTQGAGSIGVTIGGGLRVMVTVSSRDSRVSASSLPSSSFVRQLRAGDDVAPPSVTYTTPGTGPITYIIDIEQGSGSVSITDSVDASALQG